MEYLDYYDENDNYLGFDTRKAVHEKGLWHKTVHCWLYTKAGKVFFQIRKDSGKLYTTASGHVLKDESLEDAFSREIYEEIGLNLNKRNAKLISTVKWEMDLQKNDSIIKDRAKASYFIYPYQGEYKNFSFDPNEVLGLALVDAKDTLALFNDEVKTITAHFITSNNNFDKQITINDFLTLKNENAKEKYGYILKAILKEI